MIRKSKVKDQRSKVITGFTLIELLTAKQQGGRNKGFTLIELLIVMAIIALLASISIFALQGARQSSRDAKRKTDLESIRAAIEIYRADCSVYPPSLPSPPSPLQSPVGCTGSINTYMQTVPTDPSGSNYHYWTDGTIYRICACLENAPIPAMTCPGFSCSAGTGIYRVGSL